MAFSLAKDFVLLCEGSADRLFFEGLFKNRNITNIDLPPHKEIGKGNHHGWAGIGTNLKALSGDAVAYQKLRGVIVAVDATDDSAKSFDRVCRKIAKDGPFTKPTSFVKPAAPYVKAIQHNGHPPIIVMLIPSGGPGALETLCVDSIFHRKPWLQQCVATYIGCGNLDVATWGAESRDKARMQCTLAVLNVGDPNKPLAQAFSVKPPLIHFRCRVFTPLVNQIKKFCAEV